MRFLTPDNESYQEVKKYFKDDEALVEEALRALDRADLAAKKLNQRLFELRGELNAIVGPLSEIP